MGTQARQAIIRSKHFYRDHARAAATLLLFIQILNMLMLIIDFYVWLDITEPSYYTTSSIGGITELQPISDVKGWLAQQKPDNNSSNTS